VIGALRRGWSGVYSMFRWMVFIVIDGVFSCNKFTAGTRFGSSHNIISNWNCIRLNRIVSLVRFFVPGYHCDVGFLGILLRKVCQNGLQRPMMFHIASMVVRLRYGVSDRLLVSKRQRQGSFVFRWGSFDDWLIDVMSKLTESRSMALVLGFQPI